MPVPVPVIVAVLTCFNRREQTLACLGALYSAAGSAGADVQPIVVDDGSTDGTAQAVREEFPNATVIDGDGQLYWARGMHVGLAQALQRKASHVLWLNDDVRLHQNAIAHLLFELQTLTQGLGRSPILVGATSDGSGQLSYGGDVAAGRWRRFRYTRVGGEDQALRCDAMNGNCVLMEMAVARSLGNIDPVFEHAMGDTDYALRAGAAGVPVYVASGYVGLCSTNPVAGSFSDTSLPLRRRWRLMLHRKGLPWRSWLHFTRRHGGWLWPAYFAWPYISLVLSSLRSQRSAKQQ